MTANAKGICIQEARGKGRVACADLGYAHTGKVADQDKVLVLKADTAAPWPRSAALKSPAMTRTGA